MATLTYMTVGGSSRISLLVIVRHTCERLFVLNRRGGRVGGRQRELWSYRHGLQLFGDCSM